jgi:hypothetical protein
MFMISYTVIFHICLYFYDMFHILLSCDSLKDLWNVCMYSGIPRNFFGGGSTNSVEDRGQRERESGAVGP